ncbi:type III secretion system effector inositol phosphate phosphatase [Pseudomonas fluorescens]|uniref:Inositol phosphate phosphatase SopB n=1 Tax=Pseudomonas fluorescens TaxID=294 RepID=A0A5E7GGT0_PSEFL|nr:type III secretion system effector inositol phosphate phosphatase [Pseudomonas fluorescens]VVO48113.1 Inositol phosphate phosphatase SopB [Pseudomonas fluorescens]
MSLSSVIGTAQSWFRSHAEPPRSNSAGRLGGSVVSSTSAKTPLKIERLPGADAVLLSELIKAPSASTRSIHTLFELQRNRVDAAALALGHIGADQSLLKQLSHQLEASRFKEDRPATKAELKAAAHLDKDLLELIASQFRKALLSPKEAMREAKIAFHNAGQEVLNTKVWSKVETSFQHNGKHYACTQLPAAQMKLGKENIFPVSYGGHGVCSSSTCDGTHATNLWTSEIRAACGGPEQVLFKGVRHGILSPYGLEKGSIPREEGARNRAYEVVIAALFARPDLLKDALAGEEVPLRLVSTSLVTGGLWHERDMLNDQVNAWRDLGRVQPLVLSLMGDDGELRDVKIRLQVAAFNFGVNELALKFYLGQTQSDGFNATAMNQLLGDDLRLIAKPGGWVGEYLAREPKPDNVDRVWLLSLQLKDIWADKSHNRDGGEPYKAAMRAALLAFEIGAVPCWNCKSGKDRTGMLDAELKREAVALHQKGGLSAPGSPLTKDDQRLLQQTLLHGGNMEVQAYNTGAPGNKVMKDLPAMNLSYHERVGDVEVWNQAQGLSGMVKA